MKPSVLPRAKTFMSPSWVSTQASPVRGLKPKAKLSTRAWAPAEQARPRVSTRLVKVFFIVVLLVRGTPGFCTARMNRAGTASQPLQAVGQSIERGPAFGLEHFKPTVGLHPEPAARAFRVEPVDGGVDALELGGFFGPLAFLHEGVVAFG